MEVQFLYSDTQTQFLADSFAIAAGALKPLYHLNHDKPLQLFSNYALYSHFIKQRSSMPQYTISTMACSQKAAI